MKEKSKYNAQIEYAKRKKFVKIAIDVQEETRENFKNACLNNNTTYTRVLKDFISEYIKKNQKN